MMQMFWGPVTVSNDKKRIHIFLRPPYELFTTRQFGLSWHVLAFWPNADVLCSCLARDQRSVNRRRSLSVVC